MPAEGWKSVSLRDAVFESLKKKAEKERRALDKDKPVQKLGLKALSKRDAGNRKPTAEESKS